MKYVEGSFDEDYIQTLGACLASSTYVPPHEHRHLHVGVNFMEKTITVRRTTITFSIWDLGGQREFVNMLPLVCNDAVAILFMFDLSRKSTLNSVKEWYRQARGFNKVRYEYVLECPVNSPSCCGQDCYSILNRDEVRHFRHVSSRRAGRNHQTGALASLPNMRNRGALKLIYLCRRRGLRRRCMHL